MLSIDLMYLKMTLSASAINRSIIKRDHIIDQFNIMVSIGSSMETNPSVLPMFSTQFRDIEYLLSSFHAEQNSIIVQLILL